MRLLHARDLSFKLSLKKTPGYAILSHRWSDSEPSLRDIERDRDKASAGNHKIHGFADYVNSHLPELEWIWVDSCCIDQNSTAELSEGVNCMFDWYRDARVCIAYLADVEHPADQVAFRHSVWFKRGWTLQELVAPTVVIFVTESWQVIGHKGNAKHLEARLETGPNLEALISDVTGIPCAVLQNFSSSQSLSIDERMQWMTGRDTLREEDMSYALFGIFGVAPGANYGEKRSGAAQRLREAIARKQQGGLILNSHKFTSQASRPQCFIPFARDLAFVGRRAMGSIQKNFSRPGARVVLVGLGGIGKSQLAIEYCYRTVDTASNTWVLWLHASSATRFDQEILSLIDDLDISGRQDKGANVFQLLRNWLNDGARQWLVVLDNADDADFLFTAPEFGNTKSSGKARIDYFPFCQHGSILITTRRLAVARRLAAKESVVLLEPEQELAIALLQQKLGATERTAAVDKLAAALDFMPLAVAQAAAYIKQREPRCTVEDYLGKLEKSERSRSTLLKLRFDELRRDRQEAENSILLTWQISFEHMRSVRPSAADLLSRMSFYDHQGIPDFLLKGSPHSNSQDDENSDSSVEDDRDTAFEEDIVILRDYSFVSVTTDKSTLQIHRLVQLAAQVWLREETTQYKQLQAQSLHTLNELFPGAHFEQWQQCQTLQTHAKHICDAKINDNDALLVLSSIMYKAAWFAESQGLYAEAEKLAARSFRDRKRVLGEEHPDTLTSMSNLALTYSRQGRYDDAAQLGVKVLEISKRVLGEEYPHTLTSMANLALTYSHQGRYEDSTQLGVEVLEIRKRVLGEEHPDTLTSIGNLASTYSRQGRYDDAAQLGVKELEISKRVLGEEHPDTLTSISNLALMYSDQGRYDDAAQLGVKVLEIRKRVLGEEHPHTLTSMANLASTYRDQGRYDDAAQLEVEVLEIRKRVLGEEHPDTLTSMANLASTYSRQGRYDDAAQLGVEVVEIRKRVLGEEHPDTLTSMANLASTYRDQGRYDDAAQLEVEVLEISKRVLGEEHPDTLTSMANLASTYSDQGRYDDAAQLGVKVVEISKRVLGEEHPHTLTSISNLASTYSRQGRYDDAAQLGVEVVEISKRVLGEEHPHTLTTMANLALTYKLRL